MCKEKFIVFSLAIVLAAGIVLFVPVSATASDQQGQNYPSPLTLGQLPPPWSQKLPAFQRFVLVLNGEAVLDKETGLVWQRTAGDLRDWAGARVQCHYEQAGGRFGWHLPTVEQLLSLIDMSRAADEIKLPVGHPFLNVSKENAYWTASPYPGVPGFAFTVHFLYGVSLEGLGGGGIEGLAAYWCVRGGQSYIDW